MKPTNPSPPVSRPRAVSHADSVTSSAFNSQPRWISRTEPAVERRLVIQDLRERIWQVRLREDHSRALRDLLIDHPVRRQMDEAEPPQLARGGQAVDLGLARVGPEQNPGGSIVGFEEPGECFDLGARARQGIEIFAASRAARSTLLIARFAAIASGAGRGSSTTQLAGGRAAGRTGPLSRRRRRSASRLRLRP